jgi:hypothetical protein
VTDDDLTVDTDALRRAGVDIGRVAETVGSIFSDLNGACTQYVNAGGDGEIGAAVRKNYKPGEASGLDFLRRLGPSLQGDGDRIKDVAVVYEETDSNATDAAHTHGRK